MMREKTKQSSGVITILTIALLFLVILLLVVFTAKAYRLSAESQTENDVKRVLCTYVAASIKGHDSSEVKPTSFDGIPGVAIDDGDTGFSHKIYLWEGTLMEEYSMTDAPVSPKTASEIGETSDFEISYIDEDLLEIRTDKGASYVHVR